MKPRRILILIFLMVVMGFSSFLWIRNYPHSFFNNDKNTGPLHQFSAEKLISQMTLEEKVGQLFMMGFWGEESDYYIEKMIDQRYIGGVILMKYNVKTREQLKTLIQDLQGKSPKIPLFVAVDQEGGQVARVRVEGVSEFSSQAKIKNEEEAFSVAQKRAKELYELGINVNFSPVLDYVPNDQSFLWARTFQKNLKQTALLGAAMIQGYQDYIVAVPKHFLGHSPDLADPHASQVTAPFSQEEIKERVQLFKEVLTSAPGMVMVSHVIYNALQTPEPCSLSAQCIRELLKKEAGYEGVVIISDDMEMAAIQNNYSNAAAAVMAIKAGNDILLYVSDPEKQAEAYNAVIKALSTGDLSIEQIDQSVLKILKLKQKFL